MTVFVIIKTDYISSFKKTLDSIDTKIKFTLEKEKDEKLAFLDTLVTRKDGTLTTKVYRKPTHTDRYLDYNSHHEAKHKVSTASTLLHRASTLPNTNENKENEVKYVTDALKLNGYPANFISNIIKRKKPRPNDLSPEELVGIFFDLVEKPSYDGLHACPMYGV